MYKRTMLRFSIIFSAIIYWSIPLLAQVADSEEEKYQWRVRQEVLNGVYIPKDLPDALLQLNKLVGDKSKALFKSRPEDEAAHKLFFSLGRWMTHNWSLYDGSRLSVSMQQMGIYHPDSMCRFLIRVFHRSLNQKPLEIEALIQEFQDQEKAVKAKRLEQGTIIFEEKRKLPQAPNKGNNSKENVPR